MTATLKVEGCTQCGRSFSGDEPVFVCEQVRSLAWGQTMVDTFNPGGLGALDAIEMLANMEGRSPDHHVFYRIVSVN